MLSSVAWINDYLDRPADADEQADLLTGAGFPLEDRVDMAGDIQQDFEMTSNRGDCTCHVGLAREVAAASGRSLVLPDCTVHASGPNVAIEVNNTQHAACPRYTARIIRGVTVGESPASTRARLEARGDVPRNNVVDATNFVLFELGQPTHAFDLDTLEGGRIEIRMACKGELFLPLGDGAEPITLNGTELVIADALKPIALAGVKGGAATAVTQDTKNILIESATFDPVQVRHTSRLHNIASDSSFRFERGVSPLHVDMAAERLCKLILESAGGTLDKGSVAAGPPLPECHSVTMRPSRCRRLLGLEITDDDMLGSLEGLGFAPSLKDDCITCTVPCHRGDIEREVDLIEEVMRMHGFDDVPVRNRINITPVMEPIDAMRRRTLANTLAAEGFLETVTHTLTGTSLATSLGAGTAPLQLDESRAMADDALRPTLLASLLNVRQHNADQGAQPGMRLFELGSAFTNGASPEESLELCLLVDEDDSGIGPLRSAVDQVARVLGGDHANVRVEARGAPKWLSPGGTVSLNGECLGWMGRVDASIAALAGVDHLSMCAAVLRPGPWMHTDIPDAAITATAHFPPIERDISAIVDEAVSWTAIADAIDALKLPMHDGTQFVTVYRGKGVPDQHKSVSLRLRFRADDRTLTREEVEAPMQTAVDKLVSSLGAKVRSS
jgi:phenylalanyl-tRNA synthetase beta chain